MDNLARWSAQLIDLKSLFSEWERRRVAGERWTRRFREIHSACMFTLCLENETNQRYLLGFQQHGIDNVPVTVNRLFDGNFGEIEDCDILLVDDPKQYGESTVFHHRCQLVSYLNQPSISEANFVKFLEKKKLKVPRDDDLRLVIHIEQEGRLNYEFLFHYLNRRDPKCPYSQVFVFGPIGDSPRKWFCVKVYPDLLVLPELTESKAKALVRDRQQYSGTKDS